jgi:hypothetical protein
MNTVNLTAIVDALLGSPIQENDDDMFLSKIDSHRLDIVGMENQEVYNSDVTVKWRADSEYRSWGIKSIDPIIEAVSGWLEVGTIEEEAKMSTINLDGWTADATFEPGVQRDESFSLYPLGAEINVRNRTVLVKF